jgi:hypothetical protein
MKRYTIYVAGIHGTEAHNMTFVLFNSFTVTRAHGLIGGNAKKFVVITIFALAAKEADVVSLKGKFEELSGDTVAVTSEDITLL